MSDLFGAVEPRAIINFVLVSVVMGGMAAFATGRALAGTWRPFWHLPIYMLGLSAVVRFCHFALFEDPLLDGWGYVRDFAVLLAAAWLGYRQVRVWQMVRQYVWLYAPNGLLRWKSRR